MRFSLFGGGKQNKVEALNDEDVGSPMDVASRADADFPDENAGDNNNNNNRKGRFILKSFFKQPGRPGDGGHGNGSSGGRGPNHPFANRMTGINILITDSFYQDKEDEVSEERKNDSPKVESSPLLVTPEILTRQCFLFFFLSFSLHPRRTSGVAKWTCLLTPMRPRALPRAERV